MPLHVVEETDYPFRGIIQLTINPAAPLSFPLQLRIPGWAAGATIRVNGSYSPHLLPVLLPRLSVCGVRGSCRDRASHDSAYFPLVPQLGCRRARTACVLLRHRRKLVKLRDRGMTADWQVFPSTQWNYALNVDTDTPQRALP